MNPWEALTPVLDLPKEEEKQPEKPIEVNVSVEPTRYKGEPVTLFEAQALNALSDKAADISLFNAVHVDVIATGASPSATISLEGSSAAGGTYIPLPDPNSSKAAVTANTSFDVLVGSAFIKARVASISGTYGVGQGFTIVVTPFIVGSSTIVQLAAGTALAGKVGIDQTTPGTTNKVDATFNNVSPQMDDTDKVAVSIYGYNGAVGDTPVRAGPAADADPSALYGLRTISENEAFNGTSWDRIRTIASSGAGLGVQKVGTLGELITLAASAARTESANGTAVTGLGWRNRYIVLLDVTVLDTDAGDTLDVYIDVSLDGNTWLNAIHFTQKTGTDAAIKAFAILDPSNPGTSVIDVTSDAASGAVRPALFGAQMRARWAIVDAGTDDASFTFSIVAYAI